MQKMFLDSTKKDKTTANVPVQHDGIFVLTSYGSKEFGEITPQIAKEIKRESGKIRLEIGFQKNGKGFDAIYQGRGNNIVLVKTRESMNVAFLSLKQNEIGDDIYWTVESAFISRKDYLNGKIILWKK